ncbi:hypothetical protein DFH09DRAFT_1131053, partial [Mycena vulgaris]
LVHERYRPQYVLRRPPRSISPPILRSRAFLSFHGMHTRTRTYIHLTSAFSATPHCQSRPPCAQSVIGAQRYTIPVGAEVRRTAEWGGRAGRERAASGRADARHQGHSLAGAGGWSAVRRRRPKRSAYTDAGKSRARRSHAAAQCARRRDDTVRDENVQQNREAVGKKRRTRNTAVSSIWGPRRRRRRRRRRIGRRMRGGRPAPFATWSCGYAVRASCRGPIETRSTVRVVAASTIVRGVPL